MLNKEHYSSNKEALKASAQADSYIPQGIKTEIWSKI